MYSYMPYRIPFSETDQMGIVHHSYYNRYFERGRIEFLRQVGIVYRELSEEGVHFPVLRTECNYRRPLRFDDHMVIESWFSFLSKPRLCFSYRIIRQDEEPNYRFAKIRMEGQLELNTFGMSEHCCLAPDGKPQRIPDALLAKLAKYYVEGDDHGDD